MRTKDKKNIESRQKKYNPLYIQEQQFKQLLGFSLETKGLRRPCNNISEMRKEKNFQLQIQYEACTSFSNDVKMKTFSEEGKLRQFIVSKSTIEE